VPATGARIAGRRRSRRSIESSTSTSAGARADVAASEPSPARREDVLRMDFGRPSLASSLTRARGAMTRRAVTGTGSRHVEQLTVRVGGADSALAAGARKTRVVSA